MPAERVREPVDHAEEGGDVDRVDEGVLAHTGRKDCLSIGPCQLLGPECERLQETERRT